MSNNENIFYIIYIICYLIGSIPFGLILAKIFNIGDIRKLGSGNIGATNILRVGGKKLGAATLVLDGTKGILSVLLASELGACVYTSAVLTVIGHIFPIWLKFKGGKGVATSLGIIVFLDPYTGLVSLLAWGIIFYIFRYSSLASLISLATSFFYAYFMNISSGLIYTTVIIFILVTIRHASNIYRLINGKEKKFK